MRACPACFAVPTWPANASPAEPSPATCDFGHGYSPQTWPTSAWIDSLTRLLDVYEPADEDEVADEVHVCLQLDWAVFNLNGSQVRAFLHSALPQHMLLANGVRAKLRTAGTVSSGVDHLNSWGDFSNEIRTRNRYFPTKVPDPTLLKEVLLDSISHIDVDIDLYRARLFDTTPPNSTAMGAPPPELASAGRANPVGIPYLYLAYSANTCVYEARATTLSKLAIGRFRAVCKLQVLNLADIEPPDFFSLVDVESIEAQASRAASHRYLTALGEELRKPVRASDNLTDYIPTQYLCEMAKSLGLDGVLYSSSLDPTGRNVVLFDVTSCACTGDLDIVEVDSVQLNWRKVPD